MSVELSAVCVTVNTPSTGPASLPSVVPAMLTVAASLSRMSIESSSFPTSIVIWGSPAVILFSVITTVSVASTIASSMTGTLIVAEVVPAVIVTVPLSAVKSLPDVGSPGHGVGHHRVGRTLGRLRDGEQAIDRTRFVAVGRAGDADGGRIVVQDVDRVVIVGSVDRDLGSPLVIVFSVITTVSVASTIASSIIGTVIVADVLPAAIVTVAAERRKVVPDAAVPVTV